MEEQYSGRRIANTIATGGSEQSEICSDMAVMRRRRLIGQK
jgi:hypothetical protein